LQYAENIFGDEEQPDAEAALDDRGERAERDTDPEEGAG
jgi:hypothetical protein